MQETNHTGLSLCGRTPEAHQDGPTRRPLEQAPPRSRGDPLLETDSAPFEGRPFPRAVPPRSRARSPSSESRLARGSAPPSAGARHAHGRAARVRWPRTWAFNALTPQDGAIMRPGLTPRCRRTNSPGRSPSPPLWDGLCGTAGVSPVTPRAHYCTANAPDPRKRAGRTLDSLSRDPAG
jgi:hypothetical protein